ncbi:hypothetical protein [Kitasatospora camelliae]|uniref:LPXTG-motif cell wall-anchored protein n=1 Tax=Kitasatospora camelliae TaxID=3156397 RepID=A0AAU8K2P2_9ACTN
MRRTRTAAALLGAATLLGLTASAASATEAGAATITPAEAAPGQTVTVSVACGTGAGSAEKTVAVASPVLTGGSATLTAGADGRYSGPATVIPVSELPGALLRNAGRAAWKLEGHCPDGAAFASTLALTAFPVPGLSGLSGLAGADSPVAPAQAAQPAQPAPVQPAVVKPAAEQSATGGAAEEPTEPRGGVQTGLGGSVGTDVRELATGGALVAAGIGGFWLLRRRTSGENDNP